MFAIGLRMFRDKFKSFLIFSLAATGLVEMYIVLYPAIKQQSASIDQMIKSFPPELFKVMNMDASTFSFSTLESYLSTEYMSFLWPILAIIFTISLASYIAIRDIDKGTIETICSLPISRFKIFASRYITGVKMLAAFSAISLLSVVPLAILHGIDFKIMNYVIAAVGSFMFIWAVYALATFVSVMVSEKGKSTMITSAIMLSMFVMNVIANLKDSLSGLKYLSFFHYFDASVVLNKGILSDYMFIVFGVFIILATILAAVRFNGRDLSV
jgi:ABC-type transport system involved in multi-copper enzyme maturation permease subunit